MFARSVVLNVIGQFSVLAIGFGSSIILARVLGPSDRGLLALMMSAALLAMLVTGAGIPVAVGYFASRRERATTLVGNSLAYAALVAVVLVPVTLLLADQVASLLGKGRGGELWAVAAALVPLLFLEWALNNQLVGTLRFGRYNLLLIAAKVANLVAVVVLVGVLGLAVGGALVAAAIGALVIIVGCLFPLLALGPPSLDLGLFKRVYSYGVRVQVGAILQQANFRLDVVILQFFRPLSEVGYYVVAQTIAELPIILAMAFKTSILPMITRLEGEERGAMTELSIRHYLIVAGVATVANAGFGAVVIVVGYGSEFTPAVVPMLVLLPGVFFLGLGTVVAGDLQGRERPGLSSALVGLAAVFTVVLDLLLIPPFEVVGAAVASLIAYSVFGIASVVALHRISGIPLRRMLVPRRTDFARYLTALRQLRASMRAGSTGPPGRS